MPRGPDGHGPVICRGLPGTSGSGCVTSVQQCNANDRSLAFLHLGCHDPRPRGVRRRRPRPRRMRTDRSTGPASRGTAGRACARYRGGRGRGNPGPDHRPGSGPAASSAAPRPTQETESSASAVSLPACDVGYAGITITAAGSVPSVDDPGPVRGLTAPSPGATAPNAAHLQPAGHSTRRDGSGGGGEPKCSGGCDRLGVKPVH